MKIILASNNAKKLKEMRDILSSFGLEVLSQSEAGLELEVEETGTTFEENATLKAQAAVDALKLPAISDDSGLEVSALSGAPGIYSARYGGDLCHSDEERYRYLLAQMEGVEDRSARFYTSIVCIFPNGDKVVSHGVCAGEILHAPRGEGGFGYDPIFLPEGATKSMAEHTAAEKNAISHRGKALMDFREKLTAYFKQG